MRPIGAAHRLTEEQGSKLTRVIVDHPTITIGTYGFEVVARE